MTIILTALALAAAPAPAAAQPAAPATHAMHGQHARHAQSAKPDAKPHGEGCPCCKDMAGHQAAGSGKMECCAKHGEGHGAEHSGHKANR